MCKELEMKELKQIDGGLLAGALAGGILGGTAGLVCGVISGCSSGNLSGNDLWKCYTTGALAGAAIGAYTPV